MAIVETMITVSIPEGGAALGELEAAAARVVNGGGRPAPGASRRISDCEAGV